VAEQLGFLLGELAESVRGASDCFGIDLERGGEKAEQFSPYRELLNQLRAKFSIGIYNLNYDSVALSALPGIFHGFDGSGRFAQADVLARDGWDFIYHIHGSVHHTIAQGNRQMHTPEFGERIVWESDISTVEHRDVGNLRESTDQRRLLRTSIVAGSWKLDQIQEDPFLTYYSVLPRHVMEADAILIGGYGFSDDHINAVIGSVMRGRGRPPPVMVLARENPIDAPEPLSMKTGFWSIDLGRVLAVDPTKFACNGTHYTHWNPPPSDLPHARFEKHIDQPVAVWLGGFDSANVKADKICSWLDGNIDALD
jgi:hypothetical protein